MYPKKITETFWLVFHDMPCRVTASQGWRNYFKKYFEGGLVRFANYPPSKIHASLKIHDIESDSSKNRTTYKALFHNLNCRIDTGYLDHSVYPLIANTLQKLFTRLIYNYEGFVIHASAIIRQNKAFLFLGKSGAGKTSAARMSINEGYGLLSDNFTFVVKREGKFIQLPFPFDQFSSRNIISPVPINACFLLTKSERNSVINMPLNRKIKELHRNNIQIQISEDHQDFGISSLFEFICYVKIYDLHFNLKGGFWKLVS